MALVYYRALLMQDEGDGPDAEYGVVFPDLPGCTSSGHTRMEAAKQAAEALAGHIALLAEAGEALPNASDVGAPLPDWLEGARPDCGRGPGACGDAGARRAGQHHGGRRLAASHRHSGAGHGQHPVRFLAEAARAWFRKERTEWAEKRAKDLRRQLEMLRTGKMRSFENHGRGEVDTSAANIERIEGWLAELDGVVTLYDQDAIEAAAATLTSDNSHSR